MKRYTQARRNLRVVYSSKSILASDKIEGREQAEQIASDLIDLFKPHVSKVSDKFELKTSVHGTTDETWRVILDILYPGVSPWDDTQQASIFIWVYYNQNEDSIYSYYTELDTPLRNGTRDKFRHVDCKSVYDLPLDWDVVEDNIEYRFQQFEDYNAMRKAGPTRALNRLLKEHGISTSPRSKYELVWHTSGSRGGYGASRETTFTANGDWLACFGMHFKGAPTGQKFLNEYGPDLIEVMTAYASEYPTVDELLEGAGAELAASNEYTWVESLTNLTTGEVLYKADVNLEEAEEFDEDDPWFAN